MKYENIILWLVSQLVATAILLLGGYVKLISRIVAIETLLRMMGEKSARALHSPNDHHGMDELLDKYIDREYELTLDEWAALHERTERVLTAPESTKGEKALASWLSAICEHKMKCGIRKGIG